MLSAREAASLGAASRQLHRDLQVPVALKLAQDTFAGIADSEVRELEDWLLKRRLQGVAVLRGPLVDDAVPLLAALGQAQEAHRVWKWSHYPITIYREKHAQMLLDTGQPDKVIEGARPLVDSVESLHLLARAHLLRGGPGDPAEALVAIALAQSRGLPEDGTRLSQHQLLCAMAHHTLGNETQYEQCMKTALACDIADPTQVAIAYAWAGDADNAARWLRQAVGHDRCKHAWIVPLLPWTAGVRNHPAWNMLYRASVEAARRVTPELLRLTGELATPADAS